MDGNLQEAAMYIVHVSIHVKADKLEEFKAVSLDNAQHSIQEPGVARFDVIQEADRPTHFLLVEVYRSQEAAADHKKTAHYERWRVAVEPLLSEPRTRVLYRNVFPDERGWG
jgi:(4S)-4-hydroxy-5-phosphonooxypentane-2,3-dione isomerase